MHGSQARTLSQRTALAAGHLLIVAAVAWFLLSRSASDPVRTKLILTCALVYWGRVAYGTFVLLGRSVQWSEVAVVLPWLALLHGSFAYAASGAGKAGTAAWVGIALYAAGSCVNTGSEIGRSRFKRSKPGRLYTRGFFSLSRHINYFGDTVLFTGYALASGALWTLILPAVMTAGFVWQHIPALETHLAAKYQADYAAWARRTPSFLPLGFLKGNRA